MHRHRFRLALIIFVIGFFALTPNVAMAQAQPTDASQATVHGAGGLQNKGTDTANVGQDTPVITLDGFCDPMSVIGKKEKPCRTVVTRAEFEELAEASGTDELAAKTQLAAAYFRFSLLAREAQKQGMEKDPIFQKRLELSRIQLLGQTLVQDLQAKSERFSAEDLQKFFRDNPGQFERATLLRVHVPETRYVTQSNLVQDPLPDTAAEMKTLAEKIYSRARAGEDFATLQKEAFEAANLDEEPAVDLGKMSRSNLRQSHRLIFDLKPGEISALIHEAEEGYYIYKVLSNETPSFESVKADVAAALQKQRMDAWIKNIMSSAQTKLNEQYFGPEGAKTVQ